MQKLRKAVAILLAVAMVFTSVNVPAYATGTSKTAPNVSNVTLIPASEDASNITGSGSAFTVSDMYVKEPNGEQFKTIKFSVTPIEGYTAEVTVAGENSAAVGTAGITVEKLDSQENTPTHQLKIDKSKVRDAITATLAVKYTKEGSTATKNIQVTVGKIKPINSYALAGKLQTVVPAVASATYGTALDQVSIPAVGHDYKGHFVWDEEDPANTYVGVGKENSLTNVTYKAKYVPDDSELYKADAKTGIYTGEIKGFRIKITTINPKKVNLTEFQDKTLTIPSDSNKYLLNADDFAAKTTNAYLDNKSVAGKLEWLKSASTITNADVNTNRGSFDSINIKFTPNAPENGYLHPQDAVVTVAKKDATVTTNIINEPTTKFSDLVTVNENNCLIGKKWTDILSFDSYAKSRLNSVLQMTDAEPIRVNNTDYVNNYKIFVGSNPGGSPASYVDLSDLGSKSIETAGTYKVRVAVTIPLQTSIGITPKITTVLYEENVEIKPDTLSVKFFKEDNTHEYVFEKEYDGNKTVTGYDFTHAKFYLNGVALEETLSFANTSSVDIAFTDKNVSTSATDYKTIEIKGLQLSGNTNYKLPATITVKGIIKQKEVALNWTGTESPATYTPEGPAVKATYTQVAGDGGKSIDAEITKTRTAGSGNWPAVGTYTLTGSIADKNYKIKEEGGNKEVKDFKIDASTANIIKEKTMTVAGADSGTEYTVDIRDFEGFPKGVAGSVTTATENENTAAITNLSKSGYYIKFKAVSQGTTTNCKIDITFTPSSGSNYGPLKTNLNVNVISKEDRNKPSIVEIKFPDSFNNILVKDYDGNTGKDGSSETFAGTDIPSIETKLNGVKFKIKKVGDNGAVTYEWLNKSDKLKLDPANLTFKFVDANAGGTATSTVGNKDVQLTISQVNNDSGINDTYYVTEDAKQVTVKGTINPKEISVPMPTGASITKVYDGKASHSIDVAASRLNDLIGTDKNGGGKLIIKGAFQGTNPQNAGDNKIFKISDFAAEKFVLSNYKIKGKANLMATSIRGCKVTKAPLEVTIPTLIEKEYNGNRNFGAVYPVVGLVNGETGKLQCEGIFDKDDVTATKVDIDKTRCKAVDGTFNLSNYNINTNIKNLPAKIKPATINSLNDYSMTVGNNDVQIKTVSVTKFGTVPCAGQWSVSESTNKLDDLKMDYNGTNIKFKLKPNQAAGTVAKVAVTFIPSTENYESAKTVNLVINIGTGTAIQVETEVTKPAEPTTPTTGANIGMSTTEQNKVKATMDRVISAIVNQPSHTAGTIEKSIADAVAAGKKIKVDVTANEVSKSSVAADATKIETKIKGKDAFGSTAAVVQYVDLKVAVKADTTSLGNLSAISSPVEFTVKVPSTTKKFYGIARVHNNVAEIVQSTYSSATKTITFKADKFSTYAVFSYDEDPNKYVLDKIETIPNQDYTGKAIEPTLVVKNKLGNVVEKTAYKTRFINNINKGTAVVIVTGVAPYSGELTGTFVIEDAVKPIQKVENIQVETDFGMLRVTVDKSKDKRVKAYRVGYRQVKNDWYGPWKYITTRNEDATSCLIKGLVRGVGYEVKVAAVADREKNVRSDYVTLDRLYYTNRLGVRTGAMKINKINTVKRSYGGITLNARNIAYPTEPTTVRYRFEYRVRGTETWSYVLTGSNVKTINNLRHGTAYEFRVRHYYRSALDNSWVRSAYSKIKWFRIW